MRILLFTVFLAVFAVGSSPKFQMHARMGKSHQVLFRLPMSCISLAYKLERRARLYAENSTRNRFPINLIIRLVVKALHALGRNYINVHSHRIDIDSYGQYRYGRALAIIKEAQQRRPKYNYNEGYEKHYDGLSHLFKKTYNYNDVYKKHLDGLNRCARTRWDIRSHFTLAQKTSVRI